MTEPKYVGIECCRLITQTDKAGLFDVGDIDAWIPWNQVAEFCHLNTNGDEGELIITRWIAEQKDLEWDTEYE